MYFSKYKFEINKNLVGTFKNSVGTFVQNFFLNCFVLKICTWKLVEMGKTQEHLSPQSLDKTQFDQQ